MNLYGKFKDDWLSSFYLYLNPDFGYKYKENYE